MNIGVFSANATVQQRGPVTSGVVPGNEAADRSRAANSPDRPRERVVDVVFEGHEHGVADR